jgi:hypothetical protein
MTSRREAGLLMLLALAACSSKDGDASTAADARSPVAGASSGVAAASAGTSARASTMSQASSAGSSGGSAGRSAADGGGNAAAPQVSAAGAGGAQSAAAVSGAGSGSSAASAPAAAAGCTRAGLKASVDAYFKALAAHDPSMLTQASQLKFTENAQETKLGEGLVWKTAGAVEFTRSLFDTERCGTVTEAVLPNSGTDTIFGLRLQLREQKLSEIESIVVDPKNGFFPTPMGILNSKAEVWDETLPQEQRSTREVLEAAGKAYFDWFADPSIQPPFAMPCDRLENGLKTTSGDCGNLGSAGGLKHPPQRYPLTDLEAGITAGFVLFGGADIDFHMFKVVSGKIQRINAVVGPAVRSSGW